jgi:NAD(P) transhydrogenase subunit alpha
MNHISPSENTFVNTCLRSETPRQKPIGTGRSRRTSAILLLLFLSLASHLSVGQLSAQPVDADSPSDQRNGRALPPNKKTNTKAQGDRDKSSSLISEQSEGDSAKAPAARDVMTSLTVFVLAIFIGFELITKVPPTLHTPLMSGSNAISGITVVGAVLVAGRSGGLSSFLGFLAVVLATVNVVGGFMVTHRMLAMFQKR